MAFTRVQSATGSVGGSNANSVTVTTSATGTGNLLVAFITVQGSSVTITAPASWTQIDTTQGVSGGTGSIAMFYRQNSASGVTSHVFSFSASCNAAVAFEEWSGVATSGALDQEVAKQNAKSTSCTTGTTAALNGSGELAIWGLGVFGTGLLTYSSITNSYVEDTSANASSSETSKAQATLFYNTSVGAAATSSGCTMSGTGGAGNTTILAVFKPAGAGVALSVSFAGVGTLTGALDTPGAHISGTLAGVDTLSASLSVPTPAKVGVVISGTFVFVPSGTIQITTSIGRRSQATFTVLTDTSTHFAQYQQVQMYDQNLVLIFSGYIIDAPAHKPGFQPYLVHEITCIDQHYLADKRIVAQLYRNNTCGFIVNDLISTILSAEGVTVGQIALGATVPVANFGYCTVADAMDALVAAASASGIPHYWQIDQNKQMWFVPYTAITGPTVDGTTIDDGHLSGVVPTVKPGNLKYRNTQYAVGGVAQTPLNDETVQGDGQTRAFPFKYDLAAAPSLFQLNGVTKTIGTKGQTGYQYYWAQGDKVIAQDSSQTILVSTDRLHMQYVGQYPSVFTNNNAAQITAQAALDGTSGINEAVLEDKTIASAADGNAKVNQQLTQYGLPGLRFVFATQDSSYAAGQLTTVQYPPFGFGGTFSASVARVFGGTLIRVPISSGPGTQMLIEEVDISDQSDSTNLWYTVNGVVGPYDTTWVEFFGNLFNKPTTIANSISLGVTLNVPLAPSNTLAPSDTLAPG